MCFIYIINNNKKIFKLKYERKENKCLSARIINFNLNGLKFDVYRLKFTDLYTLTLDICAEYFTHTHIPCLIMIIALTVECWPFFCLFWLCIVLKLCYLMRKFQNVIVSSNRVCKIEGMLFDFFVLFCPKICSQRKNNNNK